MVVDISADRWKKYAHGTPRLMLVLLLVVLMQPREHTHSFFTCYGLWMLMLMTGLLGACLNVGLISTTTSIILLVLVSVPAIAQIINDISNGELTILVFLVKTSFGDFLAGKIDSVPFLAGFAVGVFGLLPASVLMLSFLNQDLTGILSHYSRVFPMLFVTQLVSEAGDQRLEQFVFFRHRYCFEVLTSATCLALSFGFRQPMSLVEFKAIASDLVSCISYRATNALIIFVIRLSEGERSTVRIALAIGFKIYSAICRRDFKLIKDPNTAKEVMGLATSKGKIGLESNIVAAAWRPALSLESLDGEKWRSMRDDFDSFLKIMFPSPIRASESMKAIIATNAMALVERGGVIDAQAIAHVTASSLLELVFGKRWEDEDQIFIDASWQWRKEIACRGKADVKVKQAAIVRLIGLLRKTPSLWNIHGESWLEPDRYSLILQPFLISPIINVGDVMCGVQILRPLHGEDALEMTLRTMHPFPLWERFVDKDILDTRGKEVLVAAGTHTIMFPSDVCPVVSIFGAGERKCAGIFLARPLMEEMATIFAQVPVDRFQPKRGHRFSGRHEDSTMSLPELIYLIRTVTLTLLEVWWRGER